jgi:hypothetical protein
MQSWPALLLAPLIVLAQQAFSLALATPSCRQQTVTSLHALAAGSLVLVLALTILAWRDWSSSRLAGDPPNGQAQREDTRQLRRRRFVAATGMLVGLLSAAVSLMMWVPVWMMSPCLS